MLMMQLAPLWKLLEARPRLVAVFAEWRQRLGGAFAAVEPLLLATDLEARFYPHPNPIGDPLRIIRHRNSGVVAVSTNDDGTRLELSAADIVVREVCLSTLRKRIASALGLATARTTIADTSFILLLGNWKPKAAISVPVCLVRATSRAMLDTQVRILVQDVDKPMLIHTPTGNRWDDELQGWCRTRKTLIISLDEVVGFEDSAFVAMPEWEAYLHTFSVMANLSLNTGSTTKRRPRKRAERTAMIEALKKELIKHINAAKDHAHSACEHGREPQLLPCPSKSEFARRAELKPHHFTRCYKDSPELRQLWAFAHSLDDVMKYGVGTHRRRA
jgi:hypothetical protein